MKLHKTNENEVYYYFLKNGEKRFMYRHKYYDSLGKRKEAKKSGFKTEREALRSLLDVKASILDGHTSHIEHGQMTVSQLLDLWFETKKRNWKITTVKNRKNVIERHIKPHLGHYKINKLTAATYERNFINKLIDNEKSTHSIRSYHSIFKTAVNFAVDEEILIKNRFKSIKIVGVDQLDNFLSPTELSTFLKYAKEYGNPTEWTLTLLLAYSGLRKGEAHALKWSSIDFTNNTITVDGTRDAYGPREPKTNKSYRTIEVDQKVVNQLKKYRIWCNKQKFTYGIKNKDSDLVFILKSSIPVYPNYIGDFFGKLYNKMSERNIKLKRITPHGLRHTHATILIDMLIPPTDIADRLGNTLEMIYNVYAHSFKKADNKTVSAFSKSVIGAEFGAK